MNICVGEKKLINKHNFYKQSYVNGFNLVQSYIIIIIIIGFKSNS